MDLKRGGKNNDLKKKEKRCAQIKNERNQEQENETTSKTRMREEKNTVRYGNTNAPEKLGKLKGKKLMFKH